MDLCACVTMRQSPVQRGHTNGLISRLAKLSASNFRHTAPAQEILITSHLMASTTTSTEHAPTRQPAVTISKCTLKMWICLGEHQGSLKERSFTTREKYSP